MIQVNTTTLGLAIEIDNHHASLGGGSFLEYSFWHVARQVRTILESSDSPLSFDLFSGHPVDEERHLASPDVRPQAVSRGQQVPGCPHT